MTLLSGHWYYGNTSFKDEAAEFLPARVCQQVQPKCQPAGLEPATAAALSSWLCPSQQHTAVHLVSNLYTYLPMMHYG